VSEAVTGMAALMDNAGHKHFLARSIRLSCNLPVSQK
jgi:hypothetical protein